MAPSIAETLKTSVEYGKITLGTWISTIRGLQGFAVYQYNPNSAKLLRDALNDIDYDRTNGLSEQEIISHSIDFIENYPGIDAKLAGIVLENLDVMYRH